MDSNTPASRQIESEQQHEKCLRELPGALNKRRIDSPVHEGRVVEHLCSEWKRRLYAVHNELPQTTFHPGD